MRALVVCGRVQPSSSGEVEVARIVDSDKRFVKDLLSDTVEVPDYQRSYSWDKDELNELWTDVVRFEARFPEAQLAGQEYFLGSVVALREADQRLKLIDGQQRMATLTIALAAIRDSLEELDPTAAGELHASLIQGLANPEEPVRYRLTLGVYDREVFRSLIQTRLTDRGQPKLTNPSHRLIADAQAYFEAQLKTNLATLQSSAEKVARLKRLWAVLGFHLTLVVVVGEGEDDATEVFETLNDRGVGLTTIDLLRNFLLGKAQTEKERQEIIDWWKEVFSVSDNPARVQTFLRHFWIAREGDVKARGLYKEIKRTLLDRFGKGELTPRSFSIDISTSADVYESLITRSTGDSALDQRLGEVAELGANALYPALLAGVEKLGPSQTATLADALITLFVRWSVIARRESTLLEERVFAVARSISIASNTKSALEDAVSELRAMTPSDPEFTQAFEVAILGRAGYRRHVLMRLEQTLRAQAHKDEVKAEGPETVHVEHIYPQTPAGKAQEWDDHDEWINRIGNLTLLHKRWNTQIKNGDFATVKVPALSQSVILLNQSVISHSQWNDDAVTQRQKELAAVAPDAWPI
jgi:Protein of unknown function DUF262/Protein of unknown function (DUF1524)